MAYLIHLVDGGGDNYYTIVDQEDWDYLNAPIPNFDGEIEDPAATEGIIRRMKEAYPNEDSTIYISSGSPENDRAITLTNAYENSSGFRTLKEALKHLKEIGEEIQDEYSGCMY